MEQKNKRKSQRKYDSQFKEAALRQVEKLPRYPHKMIRDKAIIALEE